jgi:serine/threonine protein kinase
MCADVAAGLAYLLKEHWIHGDLGESIEQGTLAPRCGIVCIALRIWKRICTWFYSCLTHATLASSLHIPAARNLLVGSDGSAPDAIVVKICDFGHAMQTDEDNTPVLVSRQLAFRWTAPELYEKRRSAPQSLSYSHCYTHHHYPPTLPAAAFHTTFTNFFLSFFHGV